MGKRTRWKVEFAEGVMPPTFVSAENENEALNQGLALYRYHDAVCASTKRDDAVVSAKLVVEETNSTEPGPAILARPESEWNFSRFSTKKNATSSKKRDIIETKETNK